jgi:thiamine-monophosphate kinase
MLRSGGKPGDILFVSGTPGDSTAGLSLEKGELAGTPAEIDAYLRHRFLFPTPRVELGQQLREYASACIDVSDGLFGDADKLASASACGVALNYEQLPISAQLKSAVGDTRARECALNGGEDYELCFAVPQANIDRMIRELPPAQWGYSPIGVLRSGEGTVVMRDGIVMDFSHSGWDHFGA